MPTIQYVGRPSIAFFGKRLSEISRNLKSRGVNRVFIKETEQQQYIEPCFYVMKKIEPLMSDELGIRCRAMAEHVFRGRNMGLVPVVKAYEPDWRLTSISEGRRLQQLPEREPYNVAKDVHVRCIAPMPPLLAVKLQQLNKIPPEIVEMSAKAPCPVDTKAARKGNGFLLLTPLFDDPTLFQIPIEPTAEEKARIFPPYKETLSAMQGLVRKKSSQRDIYYVRRSDSPGLKWRVELANKNAEDRLLQGDQNKVP